jgi:hypothetical protein
LQFSQDECALKKSDTESNVDKTLPEEPEESDDCLLLRIRWGRYTDLRYNGVFSPWWQQYLSDLQLKQQKEELDRVRFLFYKLSH